jgi:hypothetical protein
LSERLLELELVLVLVLDSPFEFEDEFEFEEERNCLVTVSPPHPVALSTLQHSPTPSLHHSITPSPTPLILDNRAAMIEGGWARVAETAAARLCL